MSAMTDIELIERAKNKDEEAFNSLYKKYHQSLLYTAYRLTNNEADAQDAVQLAFIQMYSSIENLRDPKYFRLWMNKIVRGKCINIFNKNKDIYADIESSEWANTYVEKKEEYLPNESFKFSSDKDTLMNIIKTLPTMYQEVLVLRFFSQLRMEEMAEILDIPEGTVKSRLYVAKRELRKAVDSYEKMNAYKLTFHIPGAMSLALILSYRSSFSSMSGKKMYSPSFANCMIGIGIVSSTMIGVAAYQGYHTLTNESKNTSEVLAKEVFIDQKDSEQYAYFKLLDWAFDETQMKNKTAKDIQEIQGYYDLLKEKQGCYWKQLESTKWVSVFENLNK